MDVRWSRKRRSSAAREIQDPTERVYVDEVCVNEKVGTRKAETPADDAEGGQVMELGVVVKGWEVRLMFRGGKSTRPGKTDRLSRRLSRTLSLLQAELKAQASGDRGVQRSGRQERNLGGREAGPAGRAAKQPPSYAHDRCIERATWRY